MKKGINNKGQALVEYVLIIALISVVIIGLVNIFGGYLKDAMTKSSCSLVGKEYKEGEYNSLVITLGNGLGDNWWCVLFPPLCLLEGEESTEVEYHSYVVDTLNKYLK